MDRKREEDIRRIERERKTYCTTDGKREEDILYNGWKEKGRHTMDGKRQGDIQRMYRVDETNSGWRRKREAGKGRID